jgi:hypothetical protein
MDIDDEQSDRLFSYEVSKTNEQEEGVTVRPGFSVRILIRLKLDWFASYAFLF